MSGMSEQKPKRNTMGSRLLEQGLITEEQLNQACYVNPEGGRYVHTVPDCAIVHPKFIPLTKVEYTDEIKAAYAFCPVCCLNEYHAETQGE